jgi:signal transduction histidine kinase
MTSDIATDPSKLGVGFVLVAGPSPWWGSEHGDVTDWFVATGLTWSSLPVVGLAAATVPSGIGWAVLMLVGAAVFVAPVVTWSAWNRWLFGTNVYVVIPLRALGALAVAISLHRSDAPLLLGLAFFGFLAGCDAALSLRAVGIQINPLRSAWLFAKSGLDLGVLLGLGAVVVVAGGRALRVALTLYGSLWMVTIVMLAIVTTMQVADSIVERHRSADQQAVREQERRERAHWIHDDVCAELRLVRLQLDSHLIDTSDVAISLGDLDHRLRLRQLDEQMASGTVRLAEVVQPFARMLQDRGIELTDVPRFDTANVVMEPDTATLVRRSISVLTSNALHAGATRIGLRALVADDAISVEVEDNAGGFVLSDVPPGRGLDTLRHEVVSLGVRTTSDGSSVTVRVRRSARQSARRRG